jgi:3'(2'), 5'-bisphosphate nucleotidase
MEIEESDVRLAGRLATEAGEILLALQRSGKLSGKELGDEGDRAANAFLVRSLRELRGDDSLLSEEEKDSAARLSARRVWIIDPLDGTREFSEGRSDWAVHVALAIDGVATVGAVALPALGKTYSSGDRKRAAKPNKPLKMLVSRTRPASEAIAIAEQLGADLVPMGSAGAKAMALVRGDADIYLHTGGQYEWDNCAPVAVAQAAGFHCSRVDGAALVYNCKNTYLPDLLMCRKDRAAEIIDRVSRLTTQLLL